MRFGKLKKSIAYLTALVCLLLSIPSNAADGRAAFRVCADPNNLPFSHKNETGFENKLASLWASKLGLPIEYTWFPQRRGFIRKTLKAKDAAGDYKCDVVMGFAEGYERVATTSPYYRSTYVLVYVKGRGLDDVKTGDDFTKLADSRKQKLRIGGFTPTPGTAWLARHGMTDQIVPFVAMSGDPNAYPGQIIEQQLVQGDLDAVIIWGPIGGYFAQQIKQHELMVIPLESEPGIQFDFGIAAGVRHGDSETKKDVEQLVQQTAGEIKLLLESYGVPLIDKK